jgi:hypothetical protein
MAQGNKVFEVYKDLPTWAKGVVVIGGIVITYVVGYTVYKKLFPAPPPQELVNISNDVSNLSQTEKPTFLDSAYDGFANEIFVAQDGWNITNSGRIKDILMMMQNNLDVAKLILAYGSRKDTIFFFVGSDTYGLLGAARHGIADDSLGLFSYRIDDVNKDWAAKGITYKI